MITQVEKLVQIKKDETSIFVIIVKDGKEKEVLGECCSVWVQDAVKGYSAIIVENTKKGILDIAREYTTNSTYTIILSGNLPLLTHMTFNHLVDYIIFKNVKACKFMGGAAYNTTYLKTTKDIFYDAVYTHNDEDFYIVENAKQLTYATEVLRNRILETHIRNGVVFKDFKNIIIERNVVIKRGVVVNSGNVIKGNTCINESAIIKENNTICNSIIGENTCIANSTIENSSIGSDCIIMPYTNINKCKIGNNVIVFGNMSLINKTIKDGRKIKNKEV